MSDGTRWAVRLPACQALAFPLRVAVLHQRYQAADNTEMRLSGVGDVRGDTFSSDPFACLA